MSETPDAYGRFKLQPAETRSRKFFTVVLMAIVWNSLTGLAIYAVVSKWNGGAQYFVAVVLLVFALIGLVMIWSIFYQTVLLLGPRVTISTGSNNFRFGGMFDINWSFTMPQLIQKVEFWLEPEGDDKEAHSYNHAVCVYIGWDNLHSAQGQHSIQLPENSPRPYITSRKINYVLTLKATIKYFPDLEIDYPIDISPR
jgi:hypothetical protein